MSSGDPGDPFGTGLRTFPNDQSGSTASATPPMPRGTVTAAAPAQGGTPGDSPAQILLPNPSEQGAKTPPVFRALKLRDGSGWEVFARTDAGSVSMGKASIPDADVVLREKGVYDDVSKAYTVPEDVAKSLTSGRLSYPDYLIEKFEEGEAGVVRSLLGQKFMRGEMAPEDALERGHLELLKARVGTAPELAWQGGFGSLVVEVLKHPAEAFRMASGEVMRNLPDILRAQGAAAGGAAKGLVAVAPALVTGPVAIPIFKGAAATGAAYYRWKYFVDSQTGTIALDLLEKKHDPATARELAQVGGIINGTLEAIGFDLMTASAQRQALKLVFARPAVRKAVMGFVSYGKGVGGEVVTEHAQTKVEQWLKDVAADTDTTTTNKPEKATKYQKQAEIWETFVKTVMSAGLISAPGAALEVREGIVEGKKDKAAAGKKAEPISAAQAEGVPQKTLPAPTSAKAAEPAGASTPENASPAPQSSASESLEGRIATVVSQGPFPESVTAHPAFVKAVEEAAPHLGDVDPGDRRGVVKAYVDIAVEHHAFRGEVQKAIMSEPTPAEMEAMSATMAAQAQKMNGLSDLAKIAAEADPDAAVAYFAGTNPTALAALRKLTDDAIRQDAADRKAAREAAKPAVEGEIVPPGGRQARTSDPMQRYEADLYEGLVAASGFEFGPEADKLLAEALKSKDPAAMERAVEAIFDDPKSLDMDSSVTEALDRITASKPAAPDFIDLVDGPVTALVEGTSEQAADAMTQLDEQESGLVPHEPPPDAHEGELVLYKSEEAAVAKLQEPDAKVEYVDPVKVSWTDIFTPDPHLAQKNPLYAMIVLGVDAMRAKQGAYYTAFREMLFDLGERATKSRDRGLADKLAPQMAEVFDFLNAETKEAEKAAWAKLTPAEKKFGALVRAFLDRAYEKLSATEGMRSRFAPEGERGYTPYTQKPMSEILRALPEKGWRKTLSSLWEAGVKRFDSDFSLKGPGGKISRPKFFKHALFRSGEIDPSLNVIKAVDNYARSLATKLALDEATPVIEAGVREFISHTDQKNPAVREMNAKLVKFVGQYVAKEKGQSILNDVIPHGSGAEALLRGASTYMALLRIAGNIKLQAVSGVGEAVSASGAVGLHGLSLGEYRLFWPSERAQAKAVLKKYADFVGESPRVEFSHPGRNLEDQLHLVAYGILGWSKANIMHAVFLASMTKEEFNSGTISDARLAGLKVTLGRFIGLPGNRSAFGATPLGLNVTQFKAWAVPAVLTIKEDASAMVKSFMETGNPMKKLTPLQKLEVVNMAFTLAAATLFSGVFLGTDPKKDGPAVRKLRQEIWSLLGALDPVIVLGVGATIPYLLRVSAMASMIGHGWATSGREGKRMRKQGWSRIRGENTPAVWKQVPESWKPKFMRKSKKGRK